MTKSILSAFGAFISALCVIVALSAFSTSGEPLFAILAAIFAFIAISAIGYGLEDTKVSEFVSNLFGGKEADDE